MGSQLLQPQEIEVFYVLPTIRKYFTQYMKQLGYPQKKIALLLHIRESTVSQYINEKRGNQIVFKEEIEKELKQAAEMIKTKADLIQHTQRILHLIRQSGALCDIHKRMSNIPESCSIESMRCC